MKTSIVWRSIKISVFFTIFLVPITLLLTGYWGYVEPCVIYSVAYFISIFLGIRYNQKAKENSDAPRLSTKIIWALVSGILSMCFAGTVAGVSVKLGGIITSIICLCVSFGISFAAIESEGWKRAVSSIPILLIAWSIAFFQSFKWLFTFNHDYFYIFHGNANEWTLLFIFGSIALILIFFIAKFAVKYISIALKWIFK